MSVRRHKATLADRADGDRPGHTCPVRTIWIVSSSGMWSASSTHASAPFMLSVTRPWPIPRPGPGTAVPDDDPQRTW